MFARLIVLCSSLLVATLVMPASASAESSGASAQPTIVPVRADADKSEVDEVALRYYASLNQKARVEAETRRLQRLHPGWMPPTDLWTARPGNPEDGPLWDLFAADKLGEIRTRIKLLQAKDPDWKVSSDLDQKLRRKELRATIMAGAESKRWPDVVMSAKNWRTDINTREVNVLWLAAEGFARTRRWAESVQVLDSILRTSSQPHERIATIQKALAFLPMSDAEKLIGLGRINSTGQNEFDEIVIDITRARISALLHDAPGNDVSASELSSFRTYAESVSDTDQVALLAWYALKQNDLWGALEYFKSAIARGGDAVIAHGLAHTLKKLGMLREAEEVAYAWREPLAANAILFIDILADQLTQKPTPLEPMRLARYAKVTLETASGEGAQALAWYAYNTCQLSTAAEWFSRAIAWFPKEETVLGYALTLRRLKRNQEFVELVNRYDGLFPTVVSLMFADTSVQSDDPCSQKSLIAASGVATNVLRQHELRAVSKLVSFVPAPSGLSFAQQQGYGIPSSNEFPIAVNLENPSRSTSEKIASAKPFAGSWRSADALIAVLNARRVNGVTAMPYERLGRTILPGWNGQQQPALSSEAILRSPRATQWSEERAIAGIQPLAANQSDSVSSKAAFLNVGDAASRFRP